jgi:hypothetical protein
MSSLRDELPFYSINLSLWALDSSGHSKQTIGWLQLIKSIAKRGPDKNLSGPGRILEGIDELAHFGSQGASLGF